MRKLKIDFTAQNPLPDGCEIGRMGEHNATTLVITPTSEMNDCAEIAAYVAAFVSEGKIIRSEPFPKAESISIPLCRQLTGDHTLGIQLEGYDTEEKLVIKSPLITELRLLPSANGDESEFDCGQSGFVSQVAANSAARHSHENAAILNKLGESDGTLTFNGESVMNTKTKTQEFDVGSYEMSVYFNAPTSRMLSFIVENSSFEIPPIPEGTEIIKIEINSDFREDFPEWVDLKDMIIYDPTMSYTLHNHRAFELEGYGLCVAVVNFITEPNVFFNAAVSDSIKKVRVTFADAAGE